MEGAVVGGGGESKRVAIGCRGITGKVDADIVKNTIITIGNTTTIEDTGSLEIDWGSILNEIGFIITADIETTPERGEGTETTIIDPLFAIIEGENIGGREDGGESDGGVTTSFSIEFATDSNDERGWITGIGEVGTIGEDAGSFFNGEDGVVDDMDAIHNNPIFIGGPNSILCDIVIKENRCFMGI